MCEFRIGDEVTMKTRSRWHDAATDQPLQDGPVFGEIYGITFIECTNGEVFIDFAHWPDSGFLASAFRKVQRRDLTVWLSTENTIEEPKRAPVVEPV